MKSARLFKVRYDYSRTRIQPSAERYIKREMPGIHWPSGTIMLEGCAIYSNMNEMEYILRKGGKFEVQYTDDIEEMRALLRDAQDLLTHCDMIFAEDALFADGHDEIRSVSGRINAWLERAKKAGMDDEEVTARADQLL